MPRGVYTRTPEILASLRAHQQARSKDTGLCQVDGCDKPSAPRRTNICEVHYYRLRRTGTTDLIPHKRKYPPTYRTAHHWVVIDRGKAASHGCIDCGSQAAHWSFAWRLVDSALWLWGEVNGTLLAYSSDSQHYEPRCRSCARHYDKDFACAGWRQARKEATQDDT